MADLETMRDYTIQYYENVDMDAPLDSDEDSPMAGDHFINDVLTGDIVAPTSHLGEWEDIVGDLKDTIKPYIFSLVSSFAYNAQSCSPRYKNLLGSYTMTS